MHMVDAVFGRGAFGDLVVILQKGLAEQGYYTARADGDLGGGTERAIMNFQSDKKLTATGAADLETWQAATHLPWPELFERCLQVTARFEGHGYQTVAGNFDGAGLTWGIIGFTLMHGEVQAILNEVQLRDPALLKSAFGSVTDELLMRIRGPNNATLIEWADSISTGASKYSVIEPWRSGFATIGAAPMVHEIQRRRARLKYFEPAIETAQRVDLQGDQAMALCFDIHVQNGGVNDSRFAAYQQLLAALPGNAKPSDKRLALAKAVADAARVQYRDDVYSRKSTLALGEGAVHGQTFKLLNWGLAID
jgi:peptidoglycan hydrolase-like protein with peptidoglycan-binding domain